MLFSSLCFTTSPSFLPCLFVDRQTVKESGEFKRERQALSDNLKNAGNALRTTGHYTGAELNKAVAGGGGGAGGASSSGGGAGAGGAGGGRMDEDDGDEEEDEEDGIAVVTQQGPGAESKLKCPVTKKLFDNPVRNDACGHIYDRKGIEMCKPKAAGKAWVCPVAGEFSAYSSTAAPAPFCLVVFLAIHHRFSLLPHTRHFSFPRRLQEAHNDADRGHEDGRDGGSGAGAAREGAGERGGG